MAFQNAVFIKPNVPFESDFKTENIAPMFRKKFVLNDTKNAKIRVCGLGYAHYYLNGQRVTEDRFIAPVSGYHKTLWFNEYDVSHLLREGENTFAVICGNGFFNETIVTGWKFNEARWRDNPKFILELEVNGEEVLVTDNTWKCNPNSAIYFNQLRMGEYYDANICSEDWINPEYNDQDWDQAIVDDNVPTGVFRKCECEPIRELKVYKPVKITKIDDKTCVYDFGQNISGYARITVKGNKGDVLTLRHAEVVDENGCICYYGMDTYYLKSGFQTDKIVCSGDEFVWSPKFVYHGFRYIEVSGVDYCDKLDISGIFVHQDIERRTEFECSDPFLNKMFHCGIMSSYCNMFYMLTDCPTREKLGWLNDAQSSCEQMLVDFKIEKLLEKWHQDIKDAMKESGELPGVAPTDVYGYRWGNGPVSDGIIFEIPYRVYLHTGDAKLLTNSIEYFDRYLNYLETRKSEEGFVEYGLADWACPGGESFVETKFVNTVLIYSFYRIAALAAKLAGNCLQGKFTQKADELKCFIKDKFIGADGYCTVDEQCAVGMLIYYDLFDDLLPLKNQLKRLVEETDYHLHCGMVGLRRVLHALNKCDLADYALKMLKVDGYPGYKVWMDGDATTLWETWQINYDCDSKNHHMYSDFMSWLIKTLGGIKFDEAKCGELEFIFEPQFLEGIDYTKLNYRTDAGNISVNWERSNNVINLTLTKDKDIKIKYNGKYLENENNVWRLEL